jgi:hypothetical protein
MHKSEKELEQERTARAIEEFLAKGGKITYVEQGQRGDQVETQSTGWGRKRKGPPKKKPK